MRKVGEGLSCSSKLEVTGTLVYVTTIEDVIDLFDKAKGKICLVHDAGITTLGPICTTGGAGSHLAIISREFGIPCIMGIQISINEIPSLIDKKVKISHDGEDKGFLYIED
jgi:phosphohistidine swiveling domain-containing protein